MFARRRRKSSFRSILKSLLYLSISFLSIIFIYLFYTNRYSVLQVIPISIVTKRATDPYIRLKYARLRNNTLQNETISSQTVFQSIIPENYYPHLPIHIFTQNLSLVKNTSKLILLGNGFFGDDKWGIGAIGTSPKDLMSQLSCPFLTDYCDITIDQSLFPLADAVVYHLRDDIDLRFANRYRRSNQRFVFALWESPNYSPELTSFDRFFNWTMTYRFKSHIIASYYYVSSYIHKSNPYFQSMIDAYSARNLSFNYKHATFHLSDENLAEKKLGTVAALISNCGSSSGRLKFVIRLKRLIDVTVYGKCGRQCPADVDCREFIAKNYYFFLSFENSLCTDYVTEKFFSTLAYPIVPVVYGRTDYSRFLPSSSFINTKDFPSLTALAQFLNQTRNNKTRYLSYFTWKKDYFWGLTQLFTPFCDLCVRLHLDSTPNIIESVDTWWNEDACEGPRKFPAS